MISMKCRDSFLKQRLLFLAEERSADSYALFVRPHRVEWEHGNAVEHQFACQLQVVHSRILNSEVESVSQGRSKVIVIYQIEPVCQQHIFHKLGSATILSYVVKKVVCTIAGCFHQCCHRMLHTVGRPAGEGVHQAITDEITKFSNSEIGL